MKSRGNYNGLQAAYIKETGKLTFDFNFTWSNTLGTVLQANPYARILEFDLKYTFYP
jgi:hypothetical protein